MNHIYIGDHPCAPHEADHECPKCGYEFDELLPEDEFACPECGYYFGEPDDEPVVSDWEDIQ